MLTKKFFCPVNGWDCPYFKKDGSCSMVDDGDDPVLECDDAYTFWCDEDHEDYFVWEDDKGNRYDEQELLEQGYCFINGEPVSYEEFLQKVEKYKRELEHAPRLVNTSGVGPT